MVATERIWSDLRDRIGGYVRHQVGNREEAEDLIQEAFLKIHQNVNSLNDEKATDAWVYRLVRNTIIDHRRRQASRPQGREALELEDVLLSQPAEVDEQEDRRLRREITDCLLPVIHELPAEQQEALRLVDLEGMSQSEAARKVGISLSGMKSRVQRGRAGLRRTIEACCALERDARGTIVDCHSCDEVEDCND